jgi:hypothetical protein
MRERIIKQFVETSFFLSQNSKFSGNQNLLDSNRSKFVCNYPAQLDNAILIYKYCGDKRLNVAKLLELAGEKMGVKWK